MSTPARLGQVSEEYPAEDMHSGTFAELFDLQPGELPFDPPPVPVINKDASATEVLDHERAPLTAGPDTNLVFEIDDVVAAQQALEVSHENVVVVEEVVLAGQGVIIIQELNEHAVQEEVPFEGDAGLVIVEEDDALEGVQLLFQENNEVEEDDALDGLQLLFLQIPEPLDLNAILQLHLDNG